MNTYPIVSYIYYCQDSAARPSGTRGVASKPKKTIERAKYFTQLKKAGIFWPLLRGISALEKDKIDGTNKL